MDSPRNSLIGSPGSRATRERHGTETLLAQRVRARELKLSLFSNGAGTPEKEIHSPEHQVTGLELPSPEPCLMSRNTMVLFSSDEFLASSSGYNFSRSTLAAPDLSIIYDWLVIVSFLANGMSKRQSHYYSLPTSYPFWI